ncbi:hypothetical protein GCM10010121_062730 [Streptomyces brasiliensis]|uniref:MmgE/PrpD C-terminal domain-containing protein n=1 Tax=Streptomyces brasiliensis TaxID=1954 RepID=A0A917NZA2_9ACTN|nr:hypothetical protein GCM10010121_062730 [Streptomyces brasiliensis]
MSLDAAVDLRRQGVPAADIRSIEVRTYSAAIDVVGDPRPRTIEEEQFSILFLVAMALIGEPIDREGTKRALHDPEVGRLTASTTVEHDPDFETAIPAHRGAGVTVTEASGAGRSATMRDRLGSPDKPLALTDQQRCPGREANSSPTG